jgi:hypothetical protein
MIVKKLLPAFVYTEEVFEESSWGQNSKTIPSSLNGNFLPQKCSHVFELTEPTCVKIGQLMLFARVERKKRIMIHTYIHMVY